ncbi:MAG: hypothetical protein AAF462_07505, partial [Thermodesulfobacteriota bacterium]
SSQVPQGDFDAVNITKYVPKGDSAPPGWHRPLPDRLPTAGYWPAIMALGITFMLWGLAVGFNEVVSTIIILVLIGLILFSLALAGWIGDLRNERKDQNE